MSFTTAKQALAMLGDRPGKPSHKADSKGSPYVPQHPRLAGGSRSSNG